MTAIADIVNKMNSFVADKNATVSLLSDKNLSKENSRKSILSVIWLKARHLLS
jgi:hypothetical protein